MTGTEILAGLEQTGTGSDKLLHLRRVFERQPELADDPDKLVAQLEKTPRFPAGTVGKIKRLAAGESPEAINGKPPPSSREASELRLARAVGLEVAEALKKDVGYQQMTADMKKEADPALQQALAEKAGVVAEEAGARQEAGQKAAQAAGIGHPEALKGKKK